MDANDSQIRLLARTCPSRHAFWQSFVTFVGARRVAEIGVHRGEFAEAILRSCGSIDTYYMIDPWRSLPRWNKPANASESSFAAHLAETSARTSFASDKVEILRGTTAEVIHHIPNESLDFLYIDGDHTLRGITIDLIRGYDKVRLDGWIGGDDFSSSIWQHGVKYEPTLVFPQAVHFAEATGSRIYGLPHQQFLIRKVARDAFRFTDLTHKYRQTELRTQLRMSNAALATAKQLARSLMASLGLR